MAGRIVIDSDRCKGCGLCIEACPRGNIVISKTPIKSGYFPAEDCGAECTGCALCAVICPDAAIEVYRDDSKTGGVIEKPPSQDRVYDRRKTNIREPV